MPVSTIWEVIPLALHPGLLPFPSCVQMCPVTRWLTCGGSTAQCSTGFHKGACLTLPGTARRAAPEVYGCIGLNQIWELCCTTPIVTPSPMVMLARADTSGICGGVCRPSLGFAGPQHCCCPCLLPTSLLYCSLQWSVSGR